MQGLRYLAVPGHTLGETLIWVLSGKYTALLVQSLQIACKCFPNGGVFVICLTSTWTTGMF